MFVPETRAEMNSLKRQMLKSAEHNKNVAQQRGEQTGEYKDKMAASSLRCGH